MKSFYSLLVLSVATLIFNEADGQKLTSVSYVGCDETMLEPQPNL